MYIFYYFGFLSNLRLPWKSEGALKFFAVLNIFFIIQDFWATSACPENRVCPGIFHCIEYTFYIQTFWATYACPEKQRVPWIHCIECIFFPILNFGATCACPEKQRVPWNFALYWNIFYYSGVLSNLRLPWKQSFSWNFSIPWRRSPLSPASYTYGNSNHIFNDRSKHNPLSGYKAHYLYRFEVFIFQEMQNSVLILCARASQTFFFCVPILKKLFVYAPPLMDSLNQWCPTSRSRSTGRPRTDPKSTARAIGNNWKKNYFYSAYLINLLFAS